MNKISIEQIEQNLHRIPANWLRNWEIKHLISGDTLDNLKECSIRATSRRKKAGLFVLFSPIIFIVFPMFLLVKVFYPLALGLNVNVANADITPKVTGIIITFLIWFFVTRKLLNDIEKCNENRRNYNRALNLLKNSLERIDPALNMKDPFLDLEKETVRSSLVIIAGMVLQSEEETRKCRFNSNESMATLISYFKVERENRKIFERVWEESLVFGIFQPYEKGNMYLAAKKQREIVGG